MNKLVEHLINLGVEEVYFCSGSRNHSLKSLFEKHFALTFHFDERVSSYMALGSAKITKQPVVVCTTSGTAVGECLPAMIEAFYSNTPLIMISADRPARLRYSSAPQAINQKDIFKNFVKSSFCGKIEDYNLKDKLDFPYHINLEIDDSIKKLPENFECQNLDLAEFEKHFNQSQSPLVLFTESDDELTSYFEQFTRLGCYLYKECTANIKDQADLLIRYDHTLVKLLKSNHFDLIIKLGKTPLSKIWRLLDNTHTDLKVISMVDSGHVGLAKAYRLSAQPVFENLTPKKLNTIIEADLETYAFDFPNSEYSILRNIINEISMPAKIVLGNSMPVRYGQMIGSDKHQFYAMRGANGIDGQISFAIGFAKKTVGPVVLLIGDLTFLYDISALLVGLPENLSIHVLNNRGGRIFERIGIHDEIILEHNWNLDNISKALHPSQIIIHPIDNFQTTQFWESLP